MRLINVVPTGTSIDFMRPRRYALFASALLCLFSIVLVLFRGLNFGIDFQGGILIEVRTPVAAEISAMRSTLNGLGLGEVQLQSFGNERDVLIRLQRQEGGEEKQNEAVNAVRAALGSEVEYRRVEAVGPKVSAELIEAGAQAVLFALLAMMIYIWFRFEWQFGVGGVVALVHDVIMTLGVFVVLQLEFNLAIVAAILTIAGYSINDTVVVYDRVRENLRKYKSMPLEKLINLSINEMLARTIVTSGTTLAAVLALYIFGGPVIQGFAFAIMWGILVGTYSSIYIATPLLIHMNLRRSRFDEDEAKKEVPARP